MRLIDADALLEHKFQEVEFHGGSLDAASYRQGWNDAIDATVENEPPVDAVPVRYGHWIEDPDGWECQCSECRHLSSCRTVYCSACGARMYGRENGNGCG